MMRNLKSILSFLLLSVSVCLMAIPPKGSGVEPRHERVANPLSKVQTKYAGNRIQRLSVLPSRIPLILVEFSDEEFSMGSPMAFDSLFNGSEYNYNGATGSVRQYFHDQSNGVYSPVFDTIGPVKLPHNSAYYGANDSYGYDIYLADIVMDACFMADSLFGIDFSQYDFDNDGVIDAVYIFHTGKGEADSNISDRIWPENWDLYSTLYYGYTNQSTYFVKGENYNLPNLDGKYLNVYVVSNEIDSRNRRVGIGTTCHEFSHVLGLPDYYTTISDSPLSGKTVGAWSLMDYGCYNNNSNTPSNYSLYDKYYMGWLEPEVLNQNQSVSMDTAYNDGKMITRTGQVPAQGACTQDTIWYIENRQQEGWDAYLPGHGMLVWQVIYDDDLWENNSVNNTALHYSVVSASGRNAYTTYSERQDVPFPGSGSVRLYTPTPLFRLNNISESNGVITLNVERTDSPTDGKEVAVRILPDGKQMVNERLIIIRNGVKYDVLGHRL